MSFTNQTKKNTYTGDGLTAAFAFSFPILDEDDLRVQLKDTNGTVTDKTLTTHYTVSGTGNRTGFTDYTSGTVTFTPGNIPLSTDTIIIKRDIAATQETDYTERGAFPAETHERALDKLTMLFLQQQESIDRSVVFDSAVTFTGTLPDPSGDKYIKFNAAGTDFEAVTLSSTAGLGNVVEDTSPQLGGNLDTNGFTVAGRNIATDGNKLDGIESGADVTDAANITVALSGHSFSSASAALGDRVLIQDVNDGSALKTTQASELVFNLNTTGVRVYNGSAQSVSASTFTKIQLDTADFDADTNFDTTTNYRWTPDRAGKYLVSGMVRFDGAGSGTDIITAIYKNGSALVYSIAGSSASGSASPLVSTIVSMNGTTDYLELYGYQASGGPLNTVNGTEHTYLCGVYIGA